MDRCPQDKCCLDKCCGYSNNLLYMFQGPSLIKVTVEILLPKSLCGGWWWWWWVAGGV